MQGTGLSVDQSSENGGPPTAHSGCGRVFWITGLSGAGKTTVAKLLHQHLLDRSRQAILLDGDVLRDISGQSSGFTLDERRAAAFRYVKLCKGFSDQGFDVVCATLSMFDTVRRWGRNNMAAFHVVYLRVPTEVLHARDPKGLYSRAEQGLERNVVGVDLPWDEPQDADLIVENSGANSPADSARRITDWITAGCRKASSEPVMFGTKAETLARTAGHVQSATLLPQIAIAAADWAENRQACLDKIAALDWDTRSFAVRSSFCDEDTGRLSNAGKYRSILRVAGSPALAQAIDQVFKSKQQIGAHDSVLIQPYVDDAKISGVLFTRDPSSGAPYHIVNFTTVGGDTTAITAGRAKDIETVVCHRAHDGETPLSVAGVIALGRELEILFGTDRLDIEYVDSASRGLILLQVRPLTGLPAAGLSDREHEAAVEQIAQKIATAAQPHPDLLGERSIFGVMPDWNPAEIIGLKPRPLALSLYRKLITDGTWAYQRDNYGYRNLRSFPLMLNFFGLPYIDVRVSFNSFVPKTLQNVLAQKLVEYYLQKLRTAPELHDKVEFEIVLSCYTLDIEHRLRALPDAIFGPKDRDTIAQHLRRLTNNLIGKEKSIWRADLVKFDELKRRRATILESDLDPVSSIYWLLEYCERYGTLPFAGLARAAFIGVQMLDSLVAVGVINRDEREAFFASLHTISSDIQHDYEALDRNAFLGKYGHLRPGTYDIRSPRYDQRADQYFDWQTPTTSIADRKRVSFALSARRREDLNRLLDENGLTFDADGLFDFIRMAIEGREYGKFIFTETLSSALTIFGDLGADCGFSLDDCSYAEIGCIREIYNGGEAPRIVLGRSIARGKDLAATTGQILLPPLIDDPADAWSFQIPHSQPNFITQLSATGRAARIDDARNRLRGAILFIQSADPGFDWIFSCGIAGFVTQFGGVNSHMAIRANELKIPAVIGAGQKYYEAWSRAEVLRIDCAGQIVEVLS